MVRLIELFAGVGSQAMALREQAGNSIVLDILKALFSELHLTE